VMITLSGQAAWIACISSSILFLAVAGWALSWRVSIRLLPLPLVALAVLSGSSLIRHRPLGDIPLLYVDVMIGLAFTFAMIKRLMNKSDYVKADQGERVAMGAEYGKRLGCIVIPLILVLLLVEYLA
jgi:hypothetical protein